LRHSIAQVRPIVTARRHADAVLDHEFRQFSPAKQDDPLLDAGDVVRRLAAEVRRCDENALARPVPL
jgi:hypothetical protein